MSNSSDSSSDIEKIENTLVGKTLHGKYLIIYRIGRGAFSTVWLCLNTNTKQYYAIKIIYPEDYDVGISEVELLKKIKKSTCKYINHLIDDFTYEVDNMSFCCMVFELLAGSVYDIMKYGKYSDGLPLNIVKKIIYQLIVAMDTLTSKFNILHTDIKPENILIVGVSNKISEIISICNKNKQLKKKPNKKIILDLEKKFCEIGDKYRDLDSDSGSDLDSDNKENKDKNKDNKNKTIELLSEEYINNISTKLSDFGNCLSLEKKTYKIQTRYYRAPEIILNCEFSDKCDIWSIGCMIFELLTGKTLFDPLKERRLTTDRAHLCAMISILGKIPDDLINKSERRVELFRKNGLIKGNINEISFKSIESQLERVLDKDLEGTVRFIHALLDYNPAKRPDLKTLLKHEWFHHIAL